MKPLYIFDLDDTLALTAHRHALLTDRGAADCWQRFFEACIDDEPNTPVIDTLQALRRAGADVWIWTGRSASVRTLTDRWLVRFGIDIKPLELRMRPVDDYRSDDVLKRQWLHEMRDLDRMRLVAAFDDREHIAVMWRSEGVQCYLARPRQ